MIEDQRVAGADAGLLAAEEFVPYTIAGGGREGYRQARTDVVLLRGPEIRSVVVAAVQVEGNLPRVVGSASGVGLGDAGLVELGQRIWLARATRELAGAHLCSAGLCRRLKIRIAQTVGKCQRACGTPRVLGVELVFVPAILAVDGGTELQSGAALLIVVSRVSFRQGTHHVHERGVVLVSVV